MAENSVSTRSRRNNSEWNVAAKRIWSEAARALHLSLLEIGRTAAFPLHSGSAESLGFRFVGPTTMYALMQATGVVDDHIHGCWLARKWPDEEEG